MAGAGLGMSIVKGSFTVPDRPGDQGLRDCLFLAFSFPLADHETTSKHGRRQVQRRYIQMHQQARRRWVGPRGQRRPPPFPSARTRWARWPRACWPPPFGYPALRHRNAACERLSCEGRGGGWPSEQCALALRGGDEGVRAPPGPAPAEALWPAPSQPPHEYWAPYAVRPGCFKPEPSSPIGISGTLHSRNHLPVWVTLRSEEV